MTTTASNDNGLTVGAAVAVVIEGVEAWRGTVAGIRGSYVVVEQGRRLDEVPCRLVQRL